MKITLLGTGDAIGTPKIGCTCPQCSFSKETGIMRLRTSLLIGHEGHHILVDSSPDLRQQLLCHGSPHIDAVIWTHGHYDHFMGYGEFYRVQHLPPVYAAPPVIAYCGEIFKFMSFSRNPVKPYTPFSLFGLTINLIEVNHPPVYSCGLVISNGNYTVGYTGDSNSNIPKDGKKVLKGVDLLFIDALVPEGFHISKHMNYQDACRLAGELKAVDFRCVHMSHAMAWGLPHTGRDGECFDFPE
jgi:phosphoribosyl 1,2-cyclic phosphate phosphodiesterase